MTGWNSQFYLFEGLGNNSPVTPRKTEVNRRKREADNPGRPVD